jgi:hypothetical protein
MIEIIVIAVVVLDDLRLRGKLRAVSAVVEKYEQQIGAEFSKLLADVKAKL